MLRIDIDMVVEVKNLGIISRGELDSSKPLILMCGPNSTGKTYLSYLLYTIFSAQYPIDPPCFKKIAKFIDENNEFLLEKEYIDEFLQAETNEIRNRTNSIFGLSPEVNKGLFRFFKLNLAISEEFFNKKIFNDGFSLDFKLVGNNIKIQKESKSKAVKVEILSPGPNIKFSNIPMWNYLIYSILRVCAHNPILSARMLTVERNSIYTFNTELSLSRNELIDRLLEVKRGESSMVDMVNNGSQRYPLAIRESLRVANDLENIQKKKSPFYEFATQIESELLHGTIGVNKTGSVEFIPQTEGKQIKRLPVHMSSSIVKTLSSLIIYLKHLAQKNDLVIIDEPEMNLHPDNQRILARIFSRMVNRGLRFVISTHSDYVIREFNNLIMGHELLAVNKGSLDAEFGYERGELLDRKKVEVLYFKPGKKGKVTTECIKLDKFGFNVESIDSTIDKQNDITQTLYESLKFGDYNE